MRESRKVLLIGYGNPGRLDDGLGPACAEAVAALDLPGLTVDSDYQLTVEDAAEIAKYDVVIFADASVSAVDPFDFVPVRPSGEPGFSTHSVEPEAVLAMAHEMFDGKTLGFALAIRGHEFNEFGETLSEQAQSNLAEAITFIEGVIRQDTFNLYDAGQERAPSRPPADRAVVSSN